MFELKYNETSQLQVRLAILESQLKVANNKIKYLEKINKEENSRKKIRWLNGLSLSNHMGLGQEGDVPDIELRLYIWLFVKKISGEKIGGLS